MKQINYYIFVFACSLGITLLIAFYYLIFNSIIANTELVKALAIVGTVITASAVWLRPSARIVAESKNKLTEIDNIYQDSKRSTKEIIDENSTSEKEKRLKGP